jgi:hypothetical protein
MGIAVAIAGAKSRIRLLGVSGSSHECGPLVFPWLGIMAEPDLPQLHIRAQIVDMPVRTVGDASVVSAAGGYAAWPEGAADIDIGAHLDPECSKAPDPEGVRVLVFEEEGVGPGESCDMLEWDIVTPGHVLVSGLILDGRGLMVAGAPLPGHDE